MMDELPALRPGKVWGIRVYPGGRHELRQCDPEQLTSVGGATLRLQAGRHAYVAPGDIQVLFNWRHMWQEGS